MARGPRVLDSTSPSTVRVTREARGRERAPVDEAGGGREHLVLAGLVRCTLPSIDYSGASAQGST